MALICDLLNIFYLQNVSLSGDFFFLMIVLAINLFNNYGTDFQMIFKCGLIWSF